MERRQPETTYQDDFEKGLSTLEDIQLLSEFSLSPLIGRAYFYLSEMKRKADEKTEAPVKNYDQVAKVLDEKLESIFTEFFSNKSKFKDFTYHKSTSNIDLKKWNLILEIVPEVLSVVTLFNYHGALDVRQDDNRLAVSGMILEEGHLQMNRKFIYVVTRKLLRQKVILTFNLEKSTKPGLLRLDLKVDISHDEALVYKVKFNTAMPGNQNSKENYCVGFSNIFCHYRALLEDVKEVGEHTVIEIGHDLSVKSFLGLPDLSRLESANKEILHFSFLFRPVSIILPVKGNLSSEAFTRGLAGEQDVSPYFQVIDFFSLFNQ